MLWLGKYGRVYMFGWLFFLIFRKLVILGEYYTSNVVFYNLFFVDTVIGGILGWMGYCIFYVIFDICFL